MKLIPGTPTVAASVRHFLETTEGGFVQGFDIVGLDGQWATLQSGRCLKLRPSMTAPARLWLLANHARDLAAEIALAASKALDGARDDESLAQRCDRYEKALREIGAWADQAAQEHGQPPLRSDEEWEEPNDARTI